MRNFIFVLPLIFLINCTGSDGKKNSSYLQNAAGQPGEIIITMDSAQWHTSIGVKIREIFSQEMQGLPREELLFTLRYVDPRKMTSLLKQAKNLIFVTTFDAKSRGARIVQNYFTPESAQMIRTDPKYFLSLADDQYAKGQKVMYLFGQSEQSLLQNLNDNSQKLIDHFNRVERARLQETLFKKSQKSISKSIKKQMKCDIDIPYGYEMALIDSGFVWIRQMDAEIDKNIFITYTPYYDREQFEKDYIIKLRDSICKKYLYEDRDEMPDSYLVTETEVPFIPVQNRQLNLNGFYCVETRGLWRTNNHTMGGPFIGITIVDEVLNRLYYVEGFVYSPGKPQRETVRELETIIHTFRVNEKKKSENQ
ncbi:MAG: DUF4837 family protein [Cyclobacteriaceae bacterium]|nr:DUF4837 family protein [Cyclobacteriaceae bacterium]